MADSRRLVVSDLLCYMVNKYSRVACRQLKSAVNDFYSADDILSAKEKLSVVIDELQIDKFPKMTRRRKDSVNKSVSEIDDIYNAIMLLDEAKMISKLPLFVSIDPDKMPSVKLTDGDMAAVMVKLSKLEEGLSTV